MGAPDTLFTFVLVKPTHYDDDGYPIQWFRSALPSNTLACMNSLGEDASRREVLGPGVRIEIDTYDETNRRVVPSRIIRDLKRRGGRALVGLVGVQSNQFPRAFDIARQFRDAGFQVCMGGFHVSGCIAMLPEMPTELKEAQGLGISLFAGEAEEHRLDEVLLDAWNGALKPLYNFMDKLPSLEGEPAPILPRKHLARTTGHYSSIDLGRGCPISARSAPSSTSRAARAASAPPTISNRSFARTGSRASTGSSSPMTILPATATGRSCSTA